eukprot:scaffold49821_cov46-Prasinocladus_malaysianus.AAC.1
MQLEPQQVELLRGDSGLMGKVLAGRPVSPENEQAALDSLSMEVMTKLNSYNGTAVLLGQLGGTGAGSDRLRLAVNLRLLPNNLIAKRSFDTLYAEGY